MSIYRSEIYQVNDLYQHTTSLFLPQIETKFLCNGDHGKQFFIFNLLSLQIQINGCFQTEKIRLHA